MGADLSKLSNEELLAMLQGSGEKPAEQREPTIVDRAARVAGLGARAVIGGATSIPTAMADVVAAPLRALTGGKYFQPPSQVLQQKMTDAGLPVPETPVERFSSAATSALSGFGSQLGAASAAAPTSMAGQGIKNVLLQQPLRQAVGTTTGALAGQGAAEAGAGPIGQTIAGLAGGMVPFAGQMISGKPLPEVQQRNEVLARGRDAGFVVPPSQANPNAVNKLLGGYAGQAATEQAAALKNQPVANAIVRKEFGIAPDAPINLQALETVRNNAAQPYREIAAIHPIAEKALEDLKQARFEKNRWYNFAERTGDPTAQDKARAFGDVANRLESTFDTLAKQIGKPDLMERLRAGRATIAKTYEVEKALDIGDVSARAIGKSFDKAPQKYTGGLRQIGEFSSAYPKATQDMMGKTPPGVSPLDYAAGGMMGASAGNYGLLGTVLGRPLARGMILSDPYQALMATPNLNPLNRNDALLLGILSGSQERQK